MTDPDLYTILPLISYVIVQFTDQSGPHFLPVKNGNSAHILGLLTALNEMY